MRECSYVVALLSSALFINFSFASDDIADVRPQIRRMQQQWLQLTPEEQAELFPTLPRRLQIRLFRHLTPEEQAELLSCQSKGLQAWLLSRITLGQKLQLWSYLPEHLKRIVWPFLPKGKKIQLISSMNFMEICRIIDFCNSQELEECLSIKEALKDQELQEWRKEHPYRYIFNNILVGGIFAAAACVFLHPLFMR